MVVGEASKLYNKNTDAKLGSFTHYAAKMARLPIHTGGLPIHTGGLPIHTGGLPMRTARPPIGTARLRMKAFYKKKSAQIYHH